MTPTKALIKHLLLNHFVNCRNIHSICGYTNCSREIIRRVEKKFNVECTRRNMVGKGRYGTPTRWIDYSLKYNHINKDGIVKMKKYLNL